jgi:hypothetical protein
MTAGSSTTTIADALLEQAKSLARKGFRVFPLEVDGNTPAHEGWQQQAAADENSADRMWRDPFGSVVPYNIGIATGQGLTVLDVDVKKGQPGLESLDDLVTFLGLDDETLTVRTRSGGLHLYYGQTPHPLRNTTSEVRQGLDIRSDGGYVVAPGSTTNGLGYTVEKDLPIKPIAPWFAEMCGRHRGKAESAEPLVELDTPDSVQRAIEWLSTAAPDAVADSGTGDHTLYLVACRVKDLGVSEGECLALVLEHYDPAKCHPPQGVEVWETKVSNAYRHGLSAPGVRHPMADFEVEELEQPALGSGKAKRERHVFIKGHESKRLVDSFTDDFLVDDLLERHAVSCLYGPSNVGKTFVMLDLALHVGAGKPWNGHETKKGAVIYVAAEGTRGIHKRIASWERHQGVDLSDVWFSSRPSPIDLLSEDGDTKSFIDAVLAEAATWGEGVKPSLIVIDTLSRALAGGDENSSVDMGAFVKHIDRIKTATGAHIAIVHHSGKDAARGMRGWSGMRAAIDTEMEVQDGVLSTTKQRDGEKLEDQPFVLSDVVLGEDRRGKPVKSAVALYGAAAEMVGPKAPTAEQTEWMEKLSDGIAAMASEKGISASDFVFTWQNAAAIWGGEPRLSRQRVEKRLQNLATLELILKRKANQWVTCSATFAT